ncbi:GNAT family N-acetyltransferase [Pontibacter sp. BT731]|uniref:GNAT family N-acetyltransferase n=1 Tax=Pontibacter coccineus TaxID=3063328 RepID=UPI0026E42CD0|nr:GNAT family N-acetyltransferase [Pontibacter sp. BT731]MDO6391279.1 GNAT family N-acetyltransferase [Pontibacter sp. BT731]
MEEAFPTPSTGRSYTCTNDLYIAMEIIHDEEDTRFYIILEGGEAELTYSITDQGHMDFDHTFVPEQHRGQGIADRLVKEGLEHAQACKCMIVPSCPVVEAYVKRHKEYDAIVNWD